MKNTIDVSVDYSFKGETYHLTTTIDLDAAMRDDGQLPNIYLLLARENNLDTYSYQYDAMESHPIVFSNATGLATECLINGEFNEEKFRQLWQQTTVLHVIQDIAYEQLKIDNLEQHTDIKNALIAAYRAGESHSTS